MGLVLCLVMPVTSSGEYRGRLMVDGGGVPIGDRTEDFTFNIIKTNKNTKNIFTLVCHMKTQT